MLNVVARHTMI